MTPEQWEKINELYNQALDINKNLRSDFLKKACAGDEKLLHQVTGLIESHEKAECFLEIPAISIAAKAIADEASKQRRPDVSARCLLTFLKGPSEGKVLLVTGHKICVFGRANDCYEIMPDADPTVGRLHFMLEIMPPDIRITDLASRNGTFINGRRIQGKKRSSPAAMAGKSASAGTLLNHGDRIRAGDSLLEVAIEKAISCAVCKTNTMLWSSVLCSEVPTALCHKCAMKVLKTVPSKRVNQPVSLVKPACVICKDSLQPESGQSPDLHYLCEKCHNCVTTDTNYFKKFLDEIAIFSNHFTASTIKNMVAIKTLGQGSFGISCIVKEKRREKQFVIRLLLLKDIPDQAHRAALMSQLKRIHELRHDSLLEILDYGLSGNTFYVASEYCKAENLKQYLARSKGKLQMDEAVPIIFQVLEGLATAHEKGLYHGSLSPENIFLSEHEDKCKVKIAEFGLASSLLTAGLIDPLEDTDEIVAGSSRYGPSHDVWTIGRIFLYMLTGQLPSDADLKQSSNKAFVESDSTSLNKHIPEISPELAEFIDRALASNARRYKDAGRMLQHLKKVNNKVIHLTLVAD